MDKVQVLDQLADRERTHSNVLVKKIQPSFDGKTRQMVINGQYPVAGALFGQLCQHMKVPSTFLRKTDERLGEKIVKHLGPKVKNVSMIVTGAKPERIYTQRVPYTKPTEVAQKLFKRFPDFDQFTLNEALDFIQLGMISQKVQTEPRVGDVVKGGVNLRFSDFGISNPEVETASYRLSCLNGATHQDFLYKIALSAKTYTEMMNNIMSGVETGVGIFETIIAPKMKVAAETKIDPMQAIRRLATQYRLDRRELDRVMAAYATEPMETMWGVTNAFTRAAQQFEYGTRRRLEVIGGSVITTADTPHCSACAAVL